jgi:PAS domain S-box-containing protein
LGLTWFHVLIITLVGPVFEYSSELTVDALFREGTLLHSTAEALPVAFFAALASWKGARRTFLATAVGFGLMSASAILVHLSGGYIELHFHFFVMLVFLALYQDWIPYLLAVAYVLIHHGVLGVLWPQLVFNHTAAFNHPWTWAGIHAFFVFWSCVGSIIAWRFNEKAFAQTKLILDSAGEGIFGLDVQLKVTFINPAAAAMLGLELRAAIGKSLHEILLHKTAGGTAHLEGAAPLLEPLTDATPRRGTGEIFQRPDGSCFPVDYISTPIIERAEIAGVVVAFTDVATRIDAEEELKARTDELKRSNAELEQFAYVASHDLQEPLRMVASYTQLFAKRYRGQLDADAEEFIAYAVDGVSRMQGLIRDLLAYSQVGTKDSGFAQADCERSLKEALGNLSIAIEESGAVVTHDPLPILVADNSQLRQVFQNLVGNAIKFRQEKPPHIHISAERKHRHWLFSVRDNGIGIDPQYADRIFIVFQRLHTSKEHPGTGIGLALCKKIVERHGGRIWIESRPREGATFYFTIANPQLTGACRSTHD